MFHLRFGGDKGQEALVLGKIGHFPWAPRVRISKEERAGHLYIIGSSGKGKSKLLENILLQDIRAGRGVGLVDPHSLLADDLLGALFAQGCLSHPALIKRLIYIDPTRTDYIVPFNVLANRTELPYDVATMVLEAFRRTWPESLREAPHFTNVILASLLVLIENGLTLMHLSRLLTDINFREECLTQVSDPEVMDFFRNRFNHWDSRMVLRNESILNKVGAFALNPRLRLMLGQAENRLDFKAIMDEGKILLLDLGHSDPETKRLIGSLVVTGLELAMRSRQRRDLWNLVIDEFAEYVASEGSLETLAQVFTAGRKYGLSLTIAHQDLSQLTPRILGALSNVQNKIIFGVGRPEAEYFARIIGRVEPEEVKREPLTNTQHELFSPLPEQWEKWADQLHFQKDRMATLATRNGQVKVLKTIDLPDNGTTPEQLEAIKQESLKKQGVDYKQAEEKIRSRFFGTDANSFPQIKIPDYELIDKNEINGKPGKSKRWS